MNSGEFSVYWWGTDGSQVEEVRFVDAETAVDRAVDLTRRPFAKVLGLCARVIVTDDEDAICFEWLKEKGVVFPPLPAKTKSA